MFGRKSTNTERAHAEPVVAHWDPHALAVLDRIETRLDRLEALVRAVPPPAPPPTGSPVREWLPVLDRFHELVLVAQGHPDLAQQFGLTGRQREVAQAAGPTEWTEPDEPAPEGLTYG